MTFFSARVSKLIIYLFFLFALYSCNKDKENDMPPAINFLAGEKFIKNNDTAKIGNALRFGIQARGTDSEITNFVIKKIMPDNSYTVVMDTGLYSMSLELEKVFYQNVEDVLDWTFVVMDKNRLSSQISLRVYKDPDSEFGGIIYYPSITMGYQNSTEFGQFLDLKKNHVYFEDSAQLLQSDIEMLAYFVEDEDLPSPVFSSPGEYDNFSLEASVFYPSIPDWTVRNFTLWDISVDNEPISTTDFNNCQNDSLIIVSYNEVWAKKKFKWASNGNVIPFQTINGNKGLIKVIRADEFDTGSIEFSLKMQL